MSKNNPITELTTSYDTTTNTFYIQLEDKHHPENNTVGVVGPEGDSVIPTTVTSNKATKRMQKIVKSILKPRMEECKRVFTIRERLVNKLLAKHPDAVVRPPNYDTIGLF
jgi:hypothetical protein